MKIVKVSMPMLALLFFCVGELAAQSPLWQNKGRIVISSDGNEHDDDDWSATPFTLAILNAAGLQNKVALYTYSDHIWGSNQTYPLKAGMCAYDHMKESALVGGAMFNYKNTRFICAVDNAEVAYNAMRDEINQSSETNPLIVIAAGPMQVIGEALNRSNKEALKYVTILSHSYWNNTHADQCHSLRTDPLRAQKWDVHEGWTWEEMKTAFEGDGLHFVLIKDQNGTDDYSGLYCKKSYFDWLKKMPSKNISYYKAGSLEWLYSRLEVCVKGKNKDCFDISDAGMAMYLITGNEDNTVDGLRKILENPLSPEKWR